MDDINGVPMEGEFAIIAVGGEVLLEIIAVGLYIASSINESVLGDNDKSIVIEGRAIGLVFRAVV